MLFSQILSANSILNPNLDDEEYFSETFTLFADLSNGAYIYGQIGVSNIGPGSKRGVCRILISLPQREAINQSIIVDKEDWLFSEKDGQLLQVKSCQLRAAENKKLLEFSGEINNQSINIILYDTPKKHKVPFDRLLTKSGYYKSDILIPWSTATVQYQLKGKTISAKGYGYADHSRSTLLPAKLAHQWVRFRGLNGGNSKLLLARQASDGVPFEGWDWQQMEEKMDSVPEAFQNLRLTNTSMKDMQHWNIDVRTKTSNYKIKTEKLLIRYAPMEESGMLAKMLSFFIGNPVTYTYRATLVSADGAELPGILEIAKINGD